MALIVLIHTVQEEHFCTVVYVRKFKVSAYIELPTESIILDRVHQNHTEVPPPPEYAITRGIKQSFEGQETLL